MTAPPTGLPFDTRPLTEPVDPKEVSAFAAELRARSSSSTTASTILSMVILGIALLVAVPLLVVMLTGLGRAWGGAQFFTLAFFGIVILVIALLAVSGWRRRRITRYRLHRFAQANGMSYESRIDDPPLPGMIFSLGRSRMATDLLRGTTPRFVEFGNHQYTVKSGKNSHTYHWGYVAVKLDVPLPNIVLDAVGNNSLFGSNLPASFRKDQRLSLEGDFDRYFTLYCPAGYERDALYLFTPDIMARFVDNAAQLDVEIVDDWLFLYTQRRVSTLDPATWAWLFGTVRALITKLDQWARWRDERLLAEHGSAAAADVAPADGSAQHGADAGAVSATASPAASPALPFAAPAGLLRPPPGVAPPGRRLKRSGRWVAIVFVILVSLVWAWMRMR